MHLKRVLAVSRVALQLGVGAATCYHQHTQCFERISAQSAFTLRSMLICSILFAHSKQNIEYGMMDTSRR